MENVVWQQQSPQYKAGKENHFPPAGARLCVLQLRSILTFLNLSFLVIVYDRATY